jgi:hypothetical protein
LSLYQESKKEEKGGKGRRRRPRGLPRAATTSLYDHPFARVEQGVLPSVALVKKERSKKEPTSALYGPKFGSYQALVSSWPIQEVNLKIHPKISTTMVG